VRKGEISCSRFEKNVEEEEGAIVTPKIGLYSSIGRGRRNMLLIELMKMKKKPL